MLGPDSSVAPLIFAAIAPLLVTDDPAEAIALAGMMALMVGAIEVGLGLGKLGFVADLLSKEVQVGYMNGLAVTIIVGQLPKLFGFSTDADGFIEECKAFVQGLDQTEHDRARDRPRDVGGAAAPPSGVEEDPRGAGGGRRRDGGHRRVRPGREGGRHGRRPAAGATVTDLPVRAARHARRAARRGARHRARVAHRHDRHVDELRRSPGRRGGPEPGDDRDGCGERLRRPVPGVRDLGERLAHRGGRAVRLEVTGDRVSPAPRSSPCSCCSCRRCCRTCRSRPSRPW